MNELKSQIRSLKRLLQRDEKLPGTVRMEKERQLQTAQRALEDTQKAQEKSDMIGRYHKIRFFDKQKATKRLKRTRKELKACEGDGEARERLAKRVDEREVDVNYAQYFPLNQHYVSLFPRKGVDNEDGVDEDVKSEQNAEDERKGDEKMRQQIRQCMSDGTLDALRNGRLLQDEAREPSPDVDEQRKANAQAMREAYQNRGRQHEEGGAEVQEEDERGGGFFE